MAVTDFTRGFWGRRTRLCSGDESRILVLPIAVAMGSAPGEPSGRWVAGCCALGLDGSNLDRADIGRPRASCAYRPHDGVDRPQQRLVTCRSMVVGERTALCTHALFDRPP